VAEVVPAARVRPFVGREAELAVVRAALEALARGVGGVQLVAGEPGVGKTRFAEEVVARAQARGVRVMSVQCPPVEGLSPYWPWLNLLRPLLATEKSARTLPGAEGLSLIDRPSVQESRGARFRLFEEVRGRLEREAGSAGLLVAIDDLHHADEPSLLLLRHLAAAAPRSHLLLLATYRPDDVHTGHPLARTIRPLASQWRVSRIALRGLNGAEVERYARAVLGPAFNNRLLDVLLVRTAGNPFFVTELLETMRVEGSERVPDSVRDMIDERLLRVSDRVVRVLRAGAVVGQDFSMAMLQAVTNQSTGDLLSDLGAAIDRRLLVRAPGPPGRFSFPHLLIREVLYEQTPALDRIRLHRRAAEAMERLHAATLDDHLGELAAHWIGAATPDALARGGAYARQAAASAMAGLGYEEAARLYEMALCADLPEEERCRLLLDGATAQYRLGEIRRSIATCRQAAGIARQIGRPDLLAEAALVVHDVGDRDANVVLADLCEEALAAQARGSSSLRARLTAQRSIVSSALSRLPPSDVRRMAAEGMDLAEDAADPAALFSALDARQRSLFGPEGDEERVRLGTRALALGAGSGRRSYAVWGHLWRIDARLKLGQTRYVDADLREVASLGSALRQPLVDWRVLTIRATLAELAGRFSDAERLIRQAHATGCPSEDGGIDCYFHGFMSGLGKLRGDFAEWEASMWEIERARPGHPPFLPSFVATAYLDFGREIEARAIYEESMARLASLSPDAVPLGLLAYLSELACAMDDQERAQQLYRALLPYRRTHLVPGYGTFACEGSLSRFLGMLASCLGQLDSAEAHLREAIDANRDAGALPFVVLSQYEWARLLGRRRRPRDLRAAAELAGQVERRAAHMGMRPLRRRVEAFARELDGRSPVRLTPREAEISRLVSGGLANREIARRLGLSVRTVESHVDHILNKLGLSSRVQIGSNP
jgi:DNA-binding CsgD family transcriptional regulator/tetratricopeptide (TPR) repeat protein